VVELRPPTNRAQRMASTINLPGLLKTGFDNRN